MFTDLSHQKSVPTQHTCLTATTAENGQMPSVCKRCAEI